MNLEKEIFDINLKDIMPNRFQPREIFEDTALQELAKSIKEHGVIQPIIVRKVGDKYEIIAGERRFRASEMAEQETIPALVRDIDDKEAAKIALLENLQRKDLTPIEEAKTYQTILKIDNITQEELAENLGKSQSAIANKIRLLNLDEDVQTALLNSEISERHARSLLSVPLENQKELLKKIKDERMTVRQLDEDIMKLTGKMPEQITEETNENVNTSSNEVVTNPQETVNGGETMNNVENNIETQQVTTNEVPEHHNINFFDGSIEEPAKNVSSNSNDILNTIESMNPQNNINVNEVPNNEPVIPVMPEVPVIENKKEDLDLDALRYGGSPVERTQNIFDTLRVSNENKNQPTEEPAIEKTEIEEQVEQSIVPNKNNNDIYDMRFAINNFRQAIQNTEKFGFNVTSSEYDNPTSYQIVISIEKK